MANTFELIASSTVGSGGAANINFTSIPATFTDLQVVASLRTDGTFGNFFYDSYITVNGTDLSWRDLIGIGTATPTSRNGTTEFVALGVTSSSATASTFGNLSIYIPNYANTSYNKSVSMDTVSEHNGSDAAKQISSGLYASNSAITSITITPYNSPTVKFAQYSSAYLYGIKNS